MILPSVLLTVFSVASAHGPGTRTIMDLTYIHGHSSIAFPGQPPYKSDVVFKNYTDKNVWIEYYSFCTPEHSGTHMDSPMHFSQGNWKTHEVPADRLVGPGVIINVKQQAAVDADYRLTVADLTKWEAKNGRIPDNAIVIMNSGWGSRFPNSSLVFNAETVGNVTLNHFPGFHIDAARWLTANRKISMVGVDTPSIDYGVTDIFEVHIELYSKNIPGLENVAYLDQVPEAGAMIYAFPLKLENGSGSPVRILAITEEMTSDSNRCTQCSPLFILHVVTMVAMRVFQYP